MSVIVVEHQWDSSGTLMGQWWNISGTVVENQWDSGGT